MTPAAEESNTPAPADEESLHRALGLTDDEFEAVGKILGRLPNHLELALYAVMWSEHCSYKSSRLHLRRLPTEGAAGPGRPGGERRGDRRRRRHRRGHPHREPQPPLRHRALPGRGHRGRGHPARHLHHGRAPAGRHGPPLLRAARRPPAALAGRGRGERHLGLRELGRRPHRRRRAHLRPLLRPEPAGQRAVHGGAADRAPGARHRHRARATWPCCSGRAPGATASAGSACWRRPASAATSGGGRRRQAAQRPGGRPLRGEAPHRGLPGVARQQAGGGHPGPRRRRAGLRHQRDGRARRRRHGRRRVGRAPARGGHGALGGDDQREPGADAGHRHARVLARGGRALRQVGGAGHRRRHGDRARARRRRPAAHPRRLDGAVLADVPAASLSDDAPLYDRPRQAPGARRTRAAAGAARATARPICWPCCARRAGSTASTTTSCSSTPWSGPGGDAALLRLAGPGLPPSERGVA